MSLIEVDDLRVKFMTRKGIREAVRGVSFSLGRERLGIVGESGSGKSMTARAIMRLVPRPGIIKANHIRLEGVDLLDLPEREMRAVRGRRISMVMQDAKFSLNPVITVGDQIIEAFLQHNRSTRAQARQRALEMLDAVLIRDPVRVMRAYPHEVSGGMGQRVMIAMMLIAGPKLLIADEPTSALDVSVQRQVMGIMDGLVRDRGMGLLLISHDVNLVAEFCDRILIMYAGRIVEVCEAGRLFGARHPYTKGLLNSLPRLDRRRSRLNVLNRDPAWTDAPGVRG